MSDFWVFGYGSLIWRPGFEFLEECKASLAGHHRSLCVHSWVHRGTKDRPGLVLGLNEGGHCEGLARRVCTTKKDAVIAYLRERELVTHVYVESWLNIKLSDGRKVKAITYVVDQNHEQYAKSQQAEQILKTVANARGKSGHNIEYVKNTVQSLLELGIRDHALERIANALPE